MPWYTDTRVLYYRKDLAAKAGVQAPTTWEELKTFIKALQDKGGAKYGTYLQPSGRGTWQTLAPFVWQAGGDMVNDPANPTEYTLDTPQWTEALSTRPGDEMRSTCLRSCDHGRASTSS